MKNIECHYKDGSLIFRTSQVYTYEVAYKILQIFSVAGLITRLRRRAPDSFRVVGSLPVDYDPFESNETKWTEVVSELVKTREMLEGKLTKY